MTSLLNPDSRKERATQQMLMTRLVNRHKGEIRTAIRQAMKAGASAFESDGESAVASAVEGERQRILRRVEAMHEAAFETLGRRVLDAATEKSAAGAGEFKIQGEDPEEAFDEAMRQYIAAHSARQVASVMDTTNSQIARIIESATREGEGIDKIARRIRTQSDQMGKVRSEVIARTEVHSAGQKAQDQAAKASGAVKQKRWISSADSRTRGGSGDAFDHWAPDGEVTDLNGQFTETGESLDHPGDPAGSPGNIIMCFAPETRVRGRFKAGTRVLYDGDVLRVQTRAGRSLTVTPNHPLMTPSGLKAAHRLGEGDDLITDGREFKSTPRIGDENADDRPATISEVFGSLAQVGASRSARVMGVDFHGDGALGQGNIEIVEVERFLMFDVESTLAQCLDDLWLIQANPVPRADVAFRDPAFDAEWALTAANRFVRRLCVSLALGGRHAAHAIVHRFAGIPRLNPAGPQVASDNASINAELTGESEDRFTLADMPTDEIISIERVPYRGHVYDLQEASGLMIADGIVTSNCRCGTGYVVD